MNLEKFPLKVYYHHGGPHYLLQYYTYQTKEKIILAKSQAAAESLIAQLIIENDCEKVLNFQAIEIVSPSNYWIELGVKLLQKKKIDNFAQEVLFNFQELRRNKQALPEIAIVCSEFLPDAEYYGDSPPEEYDIELHSGCLNCLDNKGVRFLLTPQELYDQYYQTYCDSKLSHSLSSSRAEFVSSAPEMESSKQLWKAVSNSGVELKLVTEENLIDSIPLFYFELKSSLDIEQLNIRIQDLEVQRKKEWETEQEERREEYQQEDLKRFQAIQNIFKPLSKS